MKFAGENGVAAYAAIMYVNFIFIAIFLGYSIGSAPIISYHYGAGNDGELKNLYKKSLQLVGSWGILLFVLAQFLATPLAKLFVGYDSTLLAMTQTGFRIYSLVYIINGFNIFGSSFFTALSNGVVSAVISFLRTLVFQIGAVFILPIVFGGINGIWSSVTVAELLTLCITITSVSYTHLSPMWATPTIPYSFFICLILLHIDNDFHRCLTVIINILVCFQIIFKCKRF